MTIFEDKIKKLEKIKNAAWDYVYGKLKNPRLTSGFWNSYGYRMQDLLYDIEQNHLDEYSEYQRIRQGYSKKQWDKFHKYEDYTMPNVGDLMC